MAKGFLLQLAAEGSACWLPLDGGEEAVARGTLAEAARACAGAPVTVLAGAAEVLLTAAELPLRNPRQLRQALPFALEEQLADEVEGLHFALGERLERGGLAVAVVARHWLDGVLERLRHAGLQAARLLPPVLLLPKYEGEWSVLLEGERALVRSGGAGGFAAELDTLPVLLALALREAGDGAPKRLRLRLHEVGAGARAGLATALGEALPGVETVWEEGEPLPWLAAGLRGGGTIDLLQGPYSRREQLGRLWRPWLPAAGLLALWLLVEVALSLSRGAALERQAAELAAAAEGIYREAFPEARKVVDPRVQMEQALKRLRGGPAGGGGFLDAVRVAGAPLQAAHADLRGLRYRAGQLDLEVTMKDLQTLDGLKRALEEGGKMRVEILSATNRDGGVEGRLRLRDEVGGKR